MGPNYRVETEKSEVTGMKVFQNIGALGNFDLLKRTA